MSDASPNIPEERKQKVIAVTHPAFKYLRYLDWTCGYWQITQPLEFRLGDYIERWKRDPDGDGAEDNIFKLCALIMRLEIKPEA